MDFSWHRACCASASLPFFTILRRFHLKRLVRIYPAYYTALLIAVAFGSREIWQAPAWWLLNAQNFFILHLGYWPPGVSHFWTLAVEQQYYLVWPLVLLLVPRRALVPVLLLLVLGSPITRLSSQSGGWLSMDLIPWGVLDDFALGSLLAVLMHRGVVFPHRIMDVVGLLALAAYTFLYISWEMNHPVPHWCHMQQTFLAVALMALISRAAQGRCGVASVFWSIRGWCSWGNGPTASICFTTSRRFCGQGVLVPLGPTHEPHPGDLAQAALFHPRYSPAHLGLPQVDRSAFLKIRSGERCRCMLQPVLFFSVMPSVYQPPASVYHLLQSL